MKHRIIFRLLSITLTLSLLVLAVPASPVLAAVIITVSPDDGEVGDEIAISGTGFTQDEEVYIFFSSQPAVTGDNINDEVTVWELIASPTTHATFGTFAVDIPVPNRLNDGPDSDEDEDVHGGTYYIYVTYASLTNIKAVATFTVTGFAELSIDNVDGPVGIEVEIEGIGFGTSEDIIIEYDSVDITDDVDGDIDTDGNGGFDFTYIIPESTAGDHTITVEDETGNIPEVVFTVEPEITLNPSTARAGDEVAVSGTGFGYRADIDYIELNSTDIVRSSGDYRSDRDGSFDFIFTMPSVTAGTYNFAVEDEDGNIAEAVLTVAVASATISPAIGYVGTDITVSGLNFKDNAIITITYNGTLITTDPVAVITNNIGSFSATFTAPAGQAAAYLVVVSDNISSVTAYLVITASATISQTTTIASPGYVGMEITISGSGFAVGKALTATFDSAAVTTNPASAVTDAGGSFSVAVTIPPSAGGNHVIAVSDGTTTKQFAFIMESEAPATPPLLLPEMGVKAKQPVIFDWQDVTDDSGVTYTLQISTDANFTVLTLEKTDLTASGLTLTEAEELASVSKDAPYYWRVKAVDGTSEESAWSGTGSFYVGFSLGMPDIPSWVMYILIGIGVLLIALVGLWLGRRSTSY